MNAPVIPIMPVEASEDGKRNAYAHCCPVVGHFRHYAVCLHLNKQRKDGRLEVLYADCSAAIGKKRCPATDMRKEELEAGKAIYFVERIKHMGERLVEAASNLIGIASPTKPAVTPVAKTTKKAKSVVTERIDTGSYADAINMSAKKVEEPTKVAETVKPAQGESLMELAKRMLAEKGKK